MEDYNLAYDIFYMDNSNKYYLDRMFSDERGIIKHINVFTSDIGDIEDPWYSGRYNKVVDQIYECIENILRNIS